MSPAAGCPPGTSSGKRLRLKGQGVKQRDGSTGDMIVELQIHLPETIDDETQKLIQQIDAANPMTLRNDLSF